MTDRLIGMEGAGSGRRALVLGTAPSISDIEIEAISDAFVMVLNRGFLLRDRLSAAPNSIILSNPYAVQEYGTEALALPWEISFLSSSSAGSLNDIPDHAVVFSQWEAPRMEDGFFQLDLRHPLYHSGSVVHSALQILCWMGFDEVFMAGVDMTFPKDNPHFYETVSDEKKRSLTTSQVNAERMVRGLEVAQEVLGRDGMPKVFNAGLPGTRNPFPHVDWGSVFN